jgi:hypothetical protein
MMLASVSGERIYRMMIELSWDAADTPPGGMLIP